MTDPRPQDWDPRDDNVQRDQIAAYDAMRHRFSVAFSDYLQWSLFCHNDMVRVIHDHKTFSNAASRHLSVPNAMDPPEHTHFRRLIEPLDTQPAVRARYPAGGYERVPLYITGNKPSNAEFITLHPTMVRTVLKKA
ncbi:hypothetical protein [Halomonas llamarensis]|uniref:Cytochrome P450 n=1 Tax=Halomonas llamarensis TaxID=2945104 RepID=A0ABT0SP08_9GAMM|nr:hypothetical protein [Halomonas llamarensis]MCL7929308.1 hypothetical protein [Halomonas llamarensis]